MKERRSITIDPDLADKVDKQADKEERSFSGMISFMAKKYLKRKNNE